MNNLRFCFLFLIIFIIGLAQAGTTAKFTGKVSDINGAPIANANVILLQNERGIIIDTTNEKGLFFIIKISQGKYELMVSAEGYRPAIVEDVVFEIDLTTIQNVTLKIKEGLCTEFDIHKAADHSNDRIKPIGSTMSLEELERITKGNPDSLDTHLGIDKQRLPEKDFGSNYVRGNNVVFTIDGIYVEDNYDLYEGFSLICNNPETGTNVTRAEMAQINENLGQKPTMILDSLRSSNNINVNDSILSFFVLDRASLTPIKSAIVFLTIDGVKYGAELSDESGNTKFNRIPSGIYEVLVEAEGYCTNKKIIPAQDSGAWVTGIELDKLND